MNQSRFEWWIEQHYGLLLSVCIILMAALAWFHRFIQDDAFISFRYAENLLRGNGLVWNPGERVEGYSNFLWTLLIALGMLMGFDPVPWSQLLGMISFVLSLYCTFRIAWICFGSRFIALMTVILLGWNFTFHSFATGGLETQFQTFLLVAMAYLLVRMSNGPGLNNRGLVIFAIGSACAMMTHLDSIIVCGFFTGYLLLLILRSDAEWKLKHVYLVALLLPQIILLAPWLIWKVWYYGGVFPNSFYLKTSAAFSGYVLHGVRYLDVFIVSYWLFPLCVLGLIAVRRWLSEGNRFLLISSVIILLWVSYIISIGGDFMEFRMLVPVMPFMFLLISWIVFVYIRPVMIRLIFVVLIFGGSVYHQLTFTYQKDDGIEPIPQLAAHLSHPDEDWIGIGRSLASLFAEDRSVSIATTAAGAIPFYSKLQTVDMLGVNDPWIVRHGIPVSDMAGHQVIAPMSYLLRKHVNLVIAHPLVLARDIPARYKLLVPMDIQIPWDSIRVLELPLPDNRKAIVWYLTPRKSVDDVLDKNGWNRYTLASVLK